jgi:hypothetical protein
MENMLSLTVAVAVAAASVTFSVIGLSSAPVAAGLGSVTSVVTFAVSSLTRVAPGAATCSAAGSGLAASAIIVSVGGGCAGCCGCVGGGVKPLYRFVSQVVLSK